MVPSRDAEGSRRPGIVSSSADESRRRDLLGGGRAALAGMLRGVRQGLSAGLGPDERSRSWSRRDADGAPSRGMRSNSSLRGRISRRSDRQRSRRAPHVLLRSSGMAPRVGAAGAAGSRARVERSDGHSRTIWAGAGVGWGGNNRSAVSSPGWSRRATSLGSSRNGWSRRAWSRRWSRRARSLILPLSLVARGGPAAGAVVTPPLPQPWHATCIGYPNVATLMVQTQCHKAKVCQHGAHCCAFATGLHVVNALQHKQKQ